MIQEPCGVPAAEEGRGGPWGNRTAGCGRSALVLNDWY